LRAAATLTAVALTLAATLAGVPMITAGPAHADEDTISQNVTRDGWDSREPGLSPAAVKAKSFGQIFDTKVNGQVFAQPLTVGNSVLVATEDDYVYSINRSTGAVIWSRQLGSPYAAATENCEQTPVVLPYIGVTSAPVYDPVTGTLYVSGMLSGPPGDDHNLSTARPTYDLFALNEKTGAIKWKKQIAGAPTDDSKIRFHAAIELQRTGLLLLNGSVYLGFGALCADGQADHQYLGYIAGVNTKSRTETLWTDEGYDPSDPGTGGGIWQGGSGLVAVGKSIYFGTGNGTPPPLGTAGRAAPKAAHLGQSLVQLNVERNGTLKPADFFSPGNADRMDLSDHDFGSGGPILLPFGTKKYPHLFVTADKEANIYLLNPSELGGRSRSASGSTAVFSGSPSLVDDTVTGGVGSTDHGLWGHMAAFAGRSPAGKPVDYIYYAGVGWGGIDHMYVLSFDARNPAKPVLLHVGTTPQTFGFSSGSPAITSNGAAAASAIVWEVQVTDQLGSNGTLMAFSAVPTKGALNEIWSAPLGNASQFTVPATSGGRVYVGARNDGSTVTAGDDQNVCPTDFQSKVYTGTDSSCVGEVYGFGTLSAQLAGSPFNVGRVSLGHTLTKDVTLTNTGDTAVWITKLRAPLAPFRGPAQAPVGQRIGPGAHIRIPVTFSPRARGTATGKLAVTTTDGFTTHTTTVTISGTGSAAAKNVTAVYYQPLASDGLRATFAARPAVRALPTDRAAVG
jgi:hypothetical protein